MIEANVLTGTLAQRELRERGGEFVIERAPADYGRGWVVTMDLDGGKHVIITERTIELRVFKSCDAAVSFVLKYNPDQPEIRILPDSVAGIESPRRRAAAKQTDKRSSRKKRAK